MPKRTIDRRSARTRTLLHQAHMTLALEKGYEAVSVKDICDAADIGRSTFYAHFKNKDDLQRSSIGHLRALLAERQRHALAKPDDARDRRLGFSLTMFEHARDRIDHYRAFAGGRGGAVALAAIRKILSDLVRAELAATADKKSPDDIPRELIVQYLVGAYMAVLTWWLDGGAKLPPQRIDAMFRRLATAGIAPSPPRRPAAGERS